jgi:hypothetical protein
MPRMPKLKGEQIRNLAKTIIAENPGGIRYSVLVDTIHQQNPETPINTIHGPAMSVTANPALAARRSIRSNLCPNRLVSSSSRHNTSPMSPRSFHRDTTAGPERKEGTLTLAPPCALRLTAVRGNEAPHPGTQVTPA